MKTSTLHQFINLRGNREQAFKFAFGHKGGMKSCYTKGCEIFNPLFFNIKGTDITDAHTLDMMHNREIPIAI